MSSIDGFLSDLRANRSFQLVFALFVLAGVFLAICVNLPKSDSPTTARGESALTALVCLFAGFAVLLLVDLRVRRDWFMRGATAFIGIPMIAVLLVALFR